MQLAIARFVGVTAEPATAEMGLRMWLIGVVAVLVVLNGWLASRRMLDEDAPVAGQMAIGAIVGLPLALLQAGVLVLFYSLMG